MAALCPLQCQQRVAAGALASTSGRAPVAPLHSTVLQQRSSSSNSNSSSSSLRRRLRVVPPCQAVYTGKPGSPAVDPPDSGDYMDHLWWDGDKEPDRISRRNIFTYWEWKKHRSSFRHVRHLSTIWESRIVRSLLRPVGIITAIAVAVGIYSTAFSMALLPAWMPALPVVPMTAFQLTSFALSLLLVFRTNSSYGRWHEARASFGAINTTSRDIARQVLSWLPESNPARLSLCRWLVVMCYAAKFFVRENEPLAEHLTKWLSKEEREALMDTPHPAHYTLLVLSHTMANAGLTTFQVVRLQQCLSTLYSALYACDRILNTPIPLSYTRHTSRFLTFWLVLLPLALWPTHAWAAVPAAALISFVLLGIEEIGVEIEEPFSILPLDRLCQDVERHITDMLAMDSSAQQVARVNTGMVPCSSSDEEGHRPGGSSSSSNVVDLEGHFKLDKDSPAYVFQV